MKYVQTFAVTGSGEFPFDMLRYDCCYPANEGSSAEMGGSDTRTIQMRRLLNTKLEPTALRWASFGWTVVESSVNIRKL